MMDEKRFTLRMDGTLFERVKIRADINKRSVAKEIEFILEQVLTDSPEIQEESK